MIYVATDEKDLSFFMPFMKEFKIVFLKDIAERAKLTNSNINMNLLGMVEQVICANAHTFVGTPFSTFTGYITRMRGKGGRGNMIYFQQSIFYYVIALYHP